jgi:serine/threonine-protein kinase RsbT
VLNRSDKVGLELIVEDYGPGIADIDQAMQPGHTTGGGLGFGLPGAKRLMDEMEIESEAGKGTKITVKKWRKGT